MQIGDIEILPVIDGSARLEPTEAFVAPRKRTGRRTRA